MTIKTEHWHAKNLGDGLLAYAPQAELEALFHTTYPSLESLVEHALFIRHESEGRLHCEVKVYFPPAVAKLAQLTDALPCRKPSFSGLSLLVGSEAALSRLFPDDS
jgi:hypothetical protein